MRIHYHRCPECNQLWQCTDGVYCAGEDLVEITCWTCYDLQRIMEKLGLK